jgi:hypothetical protein
MQTVGSQPDNWSHIPNFQPPKTNQIKPVGPHLNTPPKKNKKTKKKSTKSDNKIHPYIFLIKF